MDEDSDSILVIDFDDEQEENHAKVNNIGNDIQPIDYNKVNQYISKEDKSVGQKFDGISQVTSASSNGNDEHNLDDDIQVIDDDDDYEDSVRKLITVANKVGKEYIKIKKSNEAEDCRTRKSDNQELVNNNVNGGNRNRLRDSRVFFEDENQVDIDISRNRVASFVKENRPTERFGCKPDVLQGRYVMDDYKSHFVEKNNYRPRRADVAYRLEAQHDVNLYKPDTISIDEYYASVSRYASNHIPPEVPLSNDEYKDTAINRNAHRNIHRPEVLSLDEYRRINRDTNSYTYGPDAALNMHDYNYRHGTIYRDNNHVYKPPELDDGYNCGLMNRFLYNQDHRPELAFNNDQCRHIMKRDTCNHTHQEERFNDDCRYRYATMNRFPYSQPHVDDALDDYWKMSRHAYRPEIISLDYDRTSLDRHCSNVHRPALNLDLYRSNLTHFYRPDLVNTSAFREPVLKKHSYYPEGMYGYIPQMSNFNAYDDANKNDEAILNLSRRPESINVTNTSRREMDGSKLRTILSGKNYVPNSENLTHEENQRRVHIYRTTTDNIRSSDSVLKGNNSEMHINIDKSGVPIRVNRSNTVILSTNNVCQNGILNPQVQTDVLATSHTMQDRYGHRSHTVVKNIDNNGSPFNAKGHIVSENNEIPDRKPNNTVIEGDIDKVRPDNNIRFLVVFFNRVKELVKETFPEFSKSLVSEIENLGQLASNGKVKTDIQFICPLYCSVSTYSLPRLSSIDDDNKIEIHKNRTVICDVCSCIQNCYKLYKKKYFTLLSTITNERKGNENDKRRKRKIMSPSAESSSKEETIICKPKSTKYDENRSDDNLIMNRKICRNPSSSDSEGNLHKVPLEHKNAEEADSVINPLVRLKEKRLLNSLSISNSNAHGHNINKDNSINNNQMGIQKPFQNTFNENEEISTVFKTTVDKDSPDELEANLILSLSYNEITNADIISSKLKNMRNRKPDAVFTCHICTCIFTYFTSFVSHIQKEHNIKGIDEDIPDECIARKCPLCGIYSKQKLHNEHVKRAHPEIYTHKGPSGVKIRADRKRTKKRKFIFTCLVCHKDLKSREVKRHREKEHRGLTISKMFTKKLSNLH